MEDYTGWKIIVQVDADTMGDVDHDIYLELAHKRIEQAYPGAKLSIQIVPPSGHGAQIDIHTPNDDVSMAPSMRAMEQVIDDLLERAFTDACNAE